MSRLKETKEHKDMVKKRNRDKQRELYKSPYNYKTFVPGPHTRKLTERADNDKTNPK